MTTYIAPRIYVACLASYNAGILHGCWIDIDDDCETVNDQVTKMLESSTIENAEEWAIDDYEGFGAYRLAEYESLDRRCELEVFIIEHETVGLALIDYCGGDLDDAYRMLEHYAGCYQSAVDYVMEYISDMSREIPAWLEGYIDYQAIARDMELNGDITVIETGYNEAHIFFY